MRGENSPHYRGTQDPNRGKGWNALAARIRKRDEHTCQRCCARHEPGKRAFPVDHIIPWRSFEDKAEANEPINLVTLCHRCHAIKTHVIERKWLRGDTLAMARYKEILQMASLSLTQHRPYHVARD